MGAHMVGPVEGRFRRGTLRQSSLLEETRRRRPLAMAGCQTGHREERVWSGAAARMVTMTKQRRTTGKKEDSHIP